MPKRVGLPTALDLILTGKTVNGRKAKRINLVEEIYPKSLLKVVHRHFDGKKKKASLRSLEDLAAIISSQKDYLSKGT